MQLWSHLWEMLVEWTFEVLKLLFSSQVSVVQMTDAASVLYRDRELEMKSSSVRQSTNLLNDIYLFSLVYFLFQFMSSASLIYFILGPPPPLFKGLVPAYTNIKKIILSTFNHDVVILH